MHPIAEGESLSGEGATAFQPMEDVTAAVLPKASSSARSTWLLIALCCILLLSLIVPLTAFAVLGVPASPSFLSAAFQHFSFSPFTSSPRALLPLIGVCLSGMEDGSRFPGKPGTDYAIPTVSEYLYFHSSAPHIKTTLSPSSPSLVHVSAAHYRSTASVL
jgi:hypothetical protein